MTRLTVRINSNSRPLNHIHFFTEFAVMTLVMSGQCSLGLDFPLL
jgi:hypothetical protein